MMNERRGGRLLSLDPTSKKTVSSSRLITVLASKQAALLRDFKGCTRSWWRSNRESLHREGENRMQRKGEREKGRDERVPRQQLRVRFHQLTFSTLYWMATPNSKRHPHPPAPPNHTCSVCFRVIQFEEYTYDTSVERKEMEKSEKERSGIMRRRERQSEEFRMDVGSS